VRAFYAGAEAMLNLSHVEGFGLPAAEALACGTPVVCGPGLGALPFLRAGVVEVDVNQTRSIVDGARRLLDEPEYRRRLAADGLAATAGLTVTAMAQATLAVYRDAMEPG
jgi:glycosyltransferase involved in cell wall biosynthesis